jgi:alpha-2-macroglobulin
VFRTNEQPVVRLKTRNIEAMRGAPLQIDLQAYFRKMHGITGVEGLDVSLIQPDKTWTLKPEAYAKYRPLEQEVEIPFDGNEAGACVVTIGDDEWEATVLVLRSDLEVVVKASRREVLAFVQDMLTGKPAEGVELLVSNGTAVAATGQSRWRRRVQNAAGGPQGSRRRARASRCAAATRPPSTCRWPACNSRPA